MSSFFLEVNTAPIQHTSAGLCNRMWNLVAYLHKPLDAHPVFSFLQSARVSPIGWKRKGEQVSSYKKCKQRRKSGYWYYKLGAIKNVCIKWKGVERHTFVCVWDRERLNCETEINSNEVRGKKESTKQSGDWEGRRIIKRQRMIELWEEGNCRKGWLLVRHYPQSGGSQTKATDKWNHMAVSSQSRKRECWWMQTLSMKQ